MKTCITCGIEKPLTDFHQSKQNKDGFCGQCKICKNQAAHHRYLANKASYLGARKVWRESHEEELKAYRKAYAQKPEQRAQRKAWEEQNRDKMREYNRAWHERNPTYMYDLTLDEYTAMLEAQGGVCAICQQPEKFILRGKIKRLSVDHDHVTGQIRGLLCGRCNSGIGYFEEDTERLTRAMEYLQRAVKQRKIKQLGLFD